MTELRALFESTAANRWFGFRLVEGGDGRATVELPLREDFLQEGRQLHGGVLASLCDTAAAYALLPKRLGAETPGMVTIEFKINFLRAADPRGEPLTARAETVRRGRSVAVCQVEVEQNERSIATTTLTFLFLPEGSRRAPAGPTAAQ